MALIFNSQFRAWALRGLSDASCKFDGERFFVGYNFDSSKQIGTMFSYDVILERNDHVSEILRSRERVTIIREKSMPEDHAVNHSPSMVEVTYSFDLEVLAESLNKKLSTEVISEALKISNCYSLENHGSASRFSGASSPGAQGLALLIERATYDIAKEELEYARALYKRKFVKSV